MSCHRPRRGDVTDNVTCRADDVTCRPFRVRPEARRIWQQHTGGTVGLLLGQPPPPPPSAAAGLPPVSSGGAECVNAREKLRTNRSQGRHSCGGRQPMRALPINGVTEEALSQSKSSSSAASFAASPRSPRRHIDLSQLNGDLAAVEGVHGVRVISPGRQQAPAENGRIPSPCEEIPSLKVGFPSYNEGIPSHAGFRRVPSYGDIGSGSLSPGATRSSSATDLDHCLARSSSSGQPLRSGIMTNSRGRHGNADRHPSPCADSEKIPSSRVNGKGIPSSGVSGEGFPSSTAESPWPGGGDAADRHRSVRLNVPPADVSDRSSDCDLRRERIRELISNLRRSPTDVTARTVAADARELRSADRAGPVSSSAGVWVGAARVSEPPVARFSDETRLSFREQALERARAPYRAPSLAASRKFKSSETLRDGASVRPAAEPSARLLNKRKSQSVTRLSRAGDNLAAARLTDKPGAVTAHGVANRAETAAYATNGEANHHHAPSTHSRVCRGPPDDASPKSSSPAVPCQKPSSHDSTETTKDFVRLNRRLASQRCRRSRSLPRSEEAQPAAGKSLPGSLPRYLVRRQQQWRDEERRRLEAAPDPACPRGHSRMPDQERLHTLQVLRDNHGTLLSELRSLPIAHSSSRLVAQQADLEQQLQKVEEGIRIFSRPKVFIKNDA